MNLKSINLKKKIMITVLLSFIMAVSFLSAQTSEFNTIDDNGNRVGKWLFYLNNELTSIDDSLNCTFYKIVNYVSGRPIGYVNYYYKSGKLYFQTPVKSIDPDVYTDGEVKFFTETGEKTKTLNYRDGLLNGMAQYLFPDGKPYLQGNYTDNIRTGLWKQWDAKGNYGIGGFFNEKPEGKWTFYYPDGSLKSEGRFHDGIQTGVWTEYRESGEIAEGNYVNGLPDGTWVCRFKNEKPCYIGSYNKGLKDGYWQEWDIMGRLSKGNYRNNLQDGTWILSDAGGNKILEGNYTEGKEDGLWLRYDTPGNVIERTMYKNGEPVKK